MDSCRSNWKYFQLEKPLEGQILVRKSAQGECGTRAFVSLTIIKLKAHKLIRILSLCDSDTMYQAGNKVRILPSEKPNFSVTIPMELDEFPNGTQCYNFGYMDCEVLETYYGNLKRVK